MLAVIPVAALLGILKDAVEKRVLQRPENAAERKLYQGGQCSIDFRSYIG